MKKKRIPGQRRLIHQSCVSIVTGLLCLMTSSCAYLAVGTVQKKIDLHYETPGPCLYPDSSFTGLRDFVNGSNETANILMIHGLTDKKDDHYDLMTERLAYQLGLTMVSDRREEVMSGTVTNNATQRRLGFDKWKLFRWRFRDSTSRQVNFYFIYWAPITKPAKDFIHQYNRTQYRTGLATLAKDSLFIDLFGDLALYLNDDYKLQMHTAVLQSLEQIPGDIAVIGGGFGVQILFEAMQLTLDIRRGMPNATLSEKNRDIEAGKFKVGNANYTSNYNIRKVFLTSNQMPFVSLLGLSPLEEAQADTLNKQIYWQMRSFSKSKQRLEKNYLLEVISFYDPNDPFGYRLPIVRDSIMMINNVKINIADHWNIDPKKATDFILPQLKNKKAAELFLNVIDQKYPSQDIMLDIRGPANKSRNDFRIMGAIVDGSDYQFVCFNPDTLRPVPRHLDKKPRVFARSIRDVIGKIVVGGILLNLDIKQSILPFSLPSEFRDSCPDTIRTRPFMGIDRSIEHNGLTQIVTVHGVRNQEPDHFDELMSSIIKTLGFYGDPVSRRFVCAAGEDCSEVGPLVDDCYRPGTVKISEYIGVYGKRLIVYNVYWSSVTLPPKRWLDSTSIYDESSVVTKLLKKQLITDGFADIELSFRGFRAKVDSTIQAAFTEMQMDYSTFNSSDTVNNTYFITGSLGTRLLLDFLNSSKQRHVTAVSKRTETWFMLTNQLIMTALKDARLTNGNILYEDFYKQTYGSLSSYLDQPWAFRLVAFNDPNDLLSFVVPDEMMGVSPHALKVHNNYLNLAQGVSINMDALIRYVAQAERKLRKYHQETYKRRIEHFQKCEEVTCRGVAPVKPSDQAYQDYLDMLNMAHGRFEDVHHLKDSSNYINTRIRSQLRIENKSPAQIRNLFYSKKRWTTSDLHVFSDAYQKHWSRYVALRKASPRRTLIRKANFKRLYQPGLIMPFLRQISDYNHYQDFVSDFGRAHVGSKESSKVVQMMSHGFKSVTTTTVDQELYGNIHNPAQAGPCVQKKEKRSLKERFAACKDCPEGKRRKQIE